MANEYLYGAYGNLGDSVAMNAVQSGTVVVYFGLSPINLVRKYAEKNLVNNPVKLTNMHSAKQTIGYAEDWDTFGLSEAVSAHFDNSIGNIGPIYVVNVLDPDKHRQSTETVKEVTFSNGQAMISSNKIILDTLTLDGLTEGTEYSIDYNYTKGMVMINSIGTKLTGTVEARWYEVDTAMVEEEDIIGGITAEGIYTGIGALQLLYVQENAVANIIAAPGWSERPNVYNALCNAARLINGHWNAFVYADIPIMDNAAVAPVAIDTIEKAIVWKKDNGYSNEQSKVFWPQAQNALLKAFHLSTMAVVETQRTDYSHNSVPMETCGNKTVSVAKQYFGKDAINKGFDQNKSKELTSNGISTCVFWGGNWKLWGDHTAAYKYGADVDPRCIFDVSMRMLFHITNMFQREWGTVIDEPFTMQLKDRIINREQEKLDLLVAQGALIGEPSVYFIETNNSVTDMMNGNFRWDIPVTPTPPLKSASVYVAYTDAGFSSYFTE